MDLRPQSLSRLRLAALFALAGVPMFLAGWGCGSEDTWPRRIEGQGAQGVAFVSNDTCAGCHQQQFDEWADSHHDWSMRHADDKTVLGNFDDARFTHFGVESHFSKRGERYFVNTEGPDGEASDFEIKYTFGVEPLQQYLVEFPGGRLQSLTVAWDVENERWFHLYQDEHIKPDDPLHWTGRFQNWNMMCAECHSTNLRKGYEADTDSYRTSWSEINVSCQACHGPGEAHVAWARSIPEGETPEGLEHELVVDFKGTDPRYEVESCARCHSRRHQVSAEDQHGGPLLDDFMISSLREDLYYPDGQILDEVYVYGSFVQSRMYHEGVRCSDCHNPHSLQLWHPGNDLCTRCHQTSPPEDFPKLQAKNYDTPKHHFHPENSTGTQCVECHMRARTYMVVDPRRDHSFRVPRPDLSAKLGTPNACNACHEDETSEWAADVVKQWYGPSSTTGSHFAEVIAAGREGRRTAQAELIKLAQDRDQPSIARATALELLRAYPNDLSALQPLTRDDDPLIRSHVAATLQSVPPDQSAPVLGSLLDDPIRAVRIEVARVLASAPRRVLTSIDRQAFNRAFKEFEQAQQAMADTPGAHLNLAVTYVAQGDVDRAEQHYRTALGLEATFLPARLNLATLYNQLGRNDDAVTLLRETVNLVPQEGEAHYSLGLLLAEEQRIEEAADSLRQAAELLPGRARVRFNYGLALQHLGQHAGAEIQLLKAHEMDPLDPSILNAVTTLYLQRQDLPKALHFAQQLTLLVPDEPGPKQLVRALREQLGGQKADPLRSWMRR